LDGHEALGVWWQSIEDDLYGAMQKIDQDQAIALRNYFPFKPPYSLNC